MHRNEGRADEHSGPVKCDGTVHFPVLRRAAQAIVDGQGKEIAAMNSLLAGNQNP